MRKKIEEGTIIHGTLRLEDLIPCFTECLQGVLALETTDVSPEGRASHKELLERVKKDHADDYFTTEQAWWDCEDLWDALNEHAPEGLWFGALPGDGSDIGFWAYDDDQ